MQQKVIQRMWAFVLAIFFSLGVIKQLVDGLQINDSYEMGVFIGTLVIPEFFFFLAFKKKQK